MRKTVFVPLVAAIALAGCGGGGADKDGDGKISSEEAAAEAKGAVTPRAGQYQTTMKLLEMELPKVEGVDEAQMRKMMEGAMNSTTSHCVTAKDAEDAARQMMQTPQEENCSYSKFDVSGGNITATMDCKNPDGSTTTMQLDGQMGTEGSNMTMELDQVVPGMPGMPGGGKTHFKMQVESKRTGECT